MFTVYVIYNRKHKKIYIGQSEDYIRRISEHNNPDNITHKFTRQFDGSWELIYKEPCQRRSEAVRREKQLNSYRGRQFVKQYIPR